MIAAGNDRDDYGLGTAGSPGTAPDAILVAAFSNNHVYGPALDVTASDATANVKGIPFVGAAGVEAPTSWSSAQTLVDVGSITGTDGKPVSRLLCGGPSDVNGAGSNLPPGSLKGAIALDGKMVERLHAKAARQTVAMAEAIATREAVSVNCNSSPRPVWIVICCKARRLAGLAGAAGSAGAGAAAPCWD